ncbi:MAG TPA: OmpA family protein [Gammaproteobacteria bacterium]|nr:OmpA family protein [Gammaproteobacteria bacterium]
MPKRKQGKDDSERWMISYADLLTLMLAFFIVLYSQSQLNVSRLKEIAKGMIIAFHGNPAVLMHNSHSGSGILKHHASPVPKPLPSPMTPHMGHKAAHQIELRVGALQQAEAQLKKVLQPLLQSQQVELARHPLSLRIRLNAKILYPSGKAVLTPSAQTLLKKIAGVLNQIPHDYPIVIQGYTNSRPIHTSRFPSNWELSAARAVSVVHLFLANGFPGKQLSAQGFSKYHPLKSDDTRQGLRVNRRVEIVIKAPVAQLLESKRSLNSAEDSLAAQAGQQSAGGAQVQTTNSAATKQGKTQNGGQKG